MDIRKPDDSERASAVFNIGIAATVLATLKSEKEKAPGDTSQKNILFVESDTEKEAILEYKRLKTQELCDYVDQRMAEIEKKILESKGE